MFKVYNYKPSYSILVYPFHRRIDKKLVEKAKELHSAGKTSKSTFSTYANMYFIDIQAAQQITALQEASDTPFLNSAIYNLNIQFKQKQNKGLATTDTLITDLKAKRLYIETNSEADS
jgi:hypothetical protein